MLYLMEERRSSSWKVSKKIVHFFYTPWLKDADNRPILQLASDPPLHEWYLWRQPEYSFIHTNALHKILPYPFKDCNSKRATGENVEDGPCQSNCGSRGWSEAIINKFWKLWERVCFGHLLDSCGYSFSALEIEDNHTSILKGQISRMPQDPWEWS